MNEAADALYCPPDRPRPLVVSVDQVATSVQLCLSPHCTTLASLIEGAPTSMWPRPGGGWGDVVAQRGAHLDFAALAPYTCGLPLAPFLTAVLSDPAPVFEDQLREIEGVERSVVDAWLTGTFGRDVPPAYQPFQGDPHAALRRMSRALQRYFDAVVAPLWPTIRGFLDRELIRVGYLLATQPAGVVLSSLHPAMHVDGDNLIIDSPQGPHAGVLAGRRLKLTPLISSGSAILVDFNGEDEIKVGYAAPGVEELWASRHDVADDLNELAGLLGETRAAILVTLGAPDSTTTLAHRLGVSPATASSHLSALATLGLVQRARVGRRVYYNRTERGERLVMLFAKRVPALA